jgi:hypothetical protein
MQRCPDRLQQFRRTQYVAALAFGEEGGLGDHAFLCFRIYGYSCCPIVRRREDYLPMADAEDDMLAGA